jgi:hypothetical protein
MGKGKHVFKRADRVGVGQYLARYGLILADFSEVTSPKHRHFLPLSLTCFVDSFVDRRGQGGVGIHVQNGSSPASNCQQI